MASLSLKSGALTGLQGIERGVWKWTASVAGVVIMGQAANKSEAVTAAEKAMTGRSLRKRCGLSRPDGPIDSGDAITISEPNTGAGGCTSHGCGPRSCGSGAFTFFAGTIAGSVLKFPVFRCAGGE